MTITQILVLSAAVVIGLGLFQVARSFTKMALDLTALTTAVADNTTAVNAAVAALAAAKAEPDQSAVDNLTTQVQANSATLNAASTPAT